MAPASPEAHWRDLKCRCRLWNISPHLSLVRFPDAQVGRRMRAYSGLLRLTAPRNACGSPTLAAPVLRMKQPTRSSPWSATRSAITRTGSRPGAAPSRSRNTTSSSSAAAGTGWRPPTTSPRSTASPMSPCWRRAGSAAAIPAATRPSSAPTICGTRRAHLYEHVAEAVGGPVAGAQLQRHVQPARRARPRAHASTRCAALRRRVNAIRLNGIDAEFLDRGAGQGMLPDHQCSPERPLSGARRHPAAPRRHRAPRCGRLGLSRARADARGVDIIQNCEVTGFRIENGRVAGVETTRGSIGAKKVGVRRRRPFQRAAPPWPGFRLPIESHPLQALVSEPIKPVLDTRRHVQRRARLCQPVRQGRAGDRRRHRRLHLLRAARQPADHRAHDGRADRAVPDLQPRCA